MRFHDIFELLHNRLPLNFMRRCQAKFAGTEGSVFSFPSILGFTAGKR